MKRRAVLLTLAIGAALGAVACDASTDAPGGSPSVSLDDSDDASQGSSGQSITDGVVACETVNDAGTIFENAAIGASEGRMADLERQGWFAVGDRLLERIDVSQGGALLDRIEELRQAEYHDADWMEAWTALAEECEKLGVPVGVMVFTGG